MSHAICFAPADLPVGAERDHGRVAEGPDARVVGHLGGPETGKRKRVTRKADGKLTELVNLEGPGTKS